MRRFFAAFVVVFLAGALSAHAQQAITNTDVVKMVKAGLGAEIVVATIRSAPAKNFDTSPDALVQLKTGGVPEAVIAAMLAEPRPAVEEPAPPQQPYLLLLRDGQKKVVAASQAQIVQVKGEHMAKDLGTLALDGAVMAAILSAGTQAVASIGTTVGGVLIGGIAGGMVGTASLLRGAPKYTQLLALPGTASKNVVDGLEFVAELFYGEIPGIDPDAYEPRLLRVAPTKSNTRLVKAQVVKLQRNGTFEATDKSLQETVPVAVTMKSRGNATLAATGLTPGEYAVILQGKAGTGGGIYPGGSIQQAAVNVAVAAWDFTVRGGETSARR